MYSIVNTVNAVFRESIDNTHLTVANDITKLHANIVANNVDNVFDLIERESGGREVTRPTLEEEIEGWSTGANQFVPGSHDEKLTYWIPLS